MTVVLKSAAFRADRGLAYEVAWEVASDDTFGTVVQTGVALLWSGLTRGKV